MNQRGRLRRGLFALAVLVTCCSGALALDPSLDISQYAHTAWRVRDGFTKGAIFAIAQTPDGYLWLGTESGLVRFDGVRPVPWQFPAGEKLPSNFVNVLRVSRDGTLWIGTHSGLASWKDNRLTRYSELAGLGVGAVLEDRAGTVWVGAYGSSTGNLCAVRGGKLQCYAPRGFGHGVDALYQDDEGNLWVATETGLWQWAPDTPEHYVLSRGAPQSLIENDRGVLLIATTDGLKQLVGGKIQSYALPGVSGQVIATRFLVSSDGSLWVGSWQGLLRLHQGRTDVFKGIDGLSADFVLAIFEDREGSVWVGTQDGLDRFRDVAVPRISRKQGLSNPGAWSVQATPDGSIWIATADGLNQWASGHVTLYRSLKALRQNGQNQERELAISGAATEIDNSGLTGNPQSLGQDKRGRLWASTSDGVFSFESGRFVRVPGVPGGFTDSIVGDVDGSIWISNGDGEAGLFHAAPELVVKRIPWSIFGRSYAVALLPDPLRSGLWLGFADGGVAYFKGGQVRASYTHGDGLGKGMVSGLRLDSRGGIWAATEGGLTHIKEGHIATLTTRNGLPCDAVHWLMEDDDHALWLYKPCGLVRIAGSEVDAWLSDPMRVIQFTILGIADGVRTQEIPGGYPPMVTKSPDGRMWFLARDGVSVIDPHHLAFNKLPPPVHIEQITADRKTYDATSDENARLRLPPLVRDLEIDYTALSLVVPEKVRFRVKLEGFDRDWKDVGNRRQAFYGNLPPRTYRFRLTASNNSGVWNEAGTFLDFSIAPAYYQTRWFRALCVVAFLGLLWALYRLRLYQLAQRFNIRLEERVNERTRIARDLHDTLLQSFHGLLFRFQAVSDLLPEGDAKQQLDSTIDQAADAITEGRDAVQDLRSSTTVTNDLAIAIGALGRELAANQTDHNSAVFRVEVEGTPRELHPILRDEIYRIAGEAMRNAFKHAQARKIEVEIRYEEQKLSLSVRDNGKGIDSKILGEKAPAGHFGLGGMRERAEIAGGRLDVWSEVGAGTEVDLTIPASLAYAARSNRRRSWFSKKVAAIK